MKHKQLRFGEGFRVPFTLRRSQAAEMVIAPGGQEGDEENRHRGADQWLFVLSGRGVAKVEGRRIELGRGTLLLIERGERHSVLNTGRTLLKTLNFYAPPAFRPDGDPLPAGRKSARAKPAGKSR
jgi:mannose-6-phosphate isomerase-like protein (cupin superfamily)